MRYNKIRKMDISNGPGVRVSLFVQGCDFHCFRCFNPETHDFKGGKEFTKDTIDKILALSQKDYIEGLSVLGGDPMHPLNRDGVKELLIAFKEAYPKKSVWVWTGFLYENIKDCDALSYIDVLVDGQYIDKLHDPTLKFSGSSNQRVIDIPKSLENKELVLWEEKKITM